MDFELNEDLKSLQEMFRDFTNGEVRPIAEKMDQEDYFSEELWQKMADIGLFGLTVPEEYGGNNSGYMALAIALEEVCKGAAVHFCSISGMNGAFTAPILHNGTQEQKSVYITGGATGKLKGAFALTEPGCGSDAAGMKTTAVADGDNYILNGVKTFITNADRADFITTFARGYEDGKEIGPLALIVDKARDSKGLTIGKNEHKMGLHGLGLCEVAFEDCAVPKSAILGRPGDGFKVATTCLAEARMGVAASCCGIGQEAINLAVEYARQRKQFGKRISEFQNTQFVLAECQTKIDAARLLTYRCATAMDNHNAELYLSSMAKYYASEVANDVARKCLQIFGGYGYIQEYKIERIYRDLKVFEIFDGTTEVHKLLISKWMGVR